MARELQVDTLQLEALLQTLRQLQWLGPMAAPGADEPVWVLLIDPEHTPIAPLAARLLIDRSAATERFWQAGGWEKVRLSQVL
jgi:membrane protein